VVAEDIVEAPKEDIVSEEKKEVEPKKNSKPRVIKVKSNDIGTIYLKPENGSK
jgi:hypothetical protein